MEKALEITQAVEKNKADTSTGTGLVHFSGPHLLPVPSQLLIKPS